MRPETTSRARGGSALLAAMVACATAWPIRTDAAAAPAAPAPPVARAAPAAPAPAAPVPVAPATPAATSAIAVWLAGGAPPSPSTSPPPGQNRPLSAGEARQLQRLRQAARRWQAGLAPLAAAAASQGDAALLADLARLDALLGSLAWAQQLTLASYAAALRAGSDALALWRTDAAYVEPAEQPAWQEADAGAAELTTAAETGFVFGIDLGSGQTWSYTEGDAGGSAPGGSEAAPGGSDVGLGDSDAAAPVAGAEGAGAVGAVGAMAMEPGPSEEGGAGASLPVEAPAYELGDLQSDVLPAFEPAGSPLSDADAEPDPDSDRAAAPPLGWEEICRPWQPPPAPANLAACWRSPAALP